MIRRNRCFSAATRCQFDRLAGFAARFRRDESGVSAVVFGIVFCGILMFAALALDQGRLITEQMREQRALDAAVIAAAGQLGTDNQVDAATATAKSYYKANTPANGTSAVADVSVDATNGTVSAQAGGSLKMTLMKAFGYQSADVKVASRGSAVLEGQTTELVLVLDNSQALAGEPLEGLKTSAKRLVNMLFTGAENSATAKIGLVPFAGAVNVGPEHRDAAWIDGDAQAPYHADNIVPAASRFALLDQMSTPWKGCVEVRPAPHDVSDTPANPDQPQTLFVPTFAPDEPDEINAANDTYTNSYIPDAGGTCKPQEQVCEKTSNRGKCTQWKTIAIATKQAQEQSCKYKNAEPDTTTAAGPTTKGPQMHCDARPLTPLTSVKSRLINEIDAMTAVGGANIAEGVMWGWRVLSPEAPFTEGKPAGRDTRKIMVLLARGDNYHLGQRNINDSVYSAWGFGANNRLNPNSHTTSALSNSMNETTRAACRNASQAGIEIFTIEFGVSDAHTRALMKYCATHPSMNLEADNVSQLKVLFEMIGRSLRPARIAG